MLLNIRIYVLLVCTDGGNTHTTLLAKKLFLRFVSGMFLSMPKHELTTVMYEQSTFTINKPKLN
jgi:hypothetical protein